MPRIHPVAVFSWQEIHFSSLHVQGVRLRFQDRRQARDAAGNLDSASLAEGRLTLEEIPISACLRPEYRSLWKGYPGASLVFSGTLQDPNLRREIWFRELAYGDQRFGTARDALSIVDRQARFQLQTPDSSVVLDGAMELEPDLPFSLQGESRNADLTPFLYLAGRRELGYSGALSGRLRATGLARHPEQVRANMDIDALRLEAGSRTLELTHPAHVRIKDGVTTIRDLRISGSEGSLRIDGRAARLGDLDMRVDMEDFRLSHQRNCSLRRRMQIYVGVGHGI